MKPKVKVVKVISVGGKRYASARNAATAYALAKSNEWWHKRLTEDNVDLSAFTHDRVKRIYRRTLPIFERMLA